MSEETRTRWLPFARALPRVSIDLSNADQPFNTGIEMSATWCIRGKPTCHADSRFTVDASPIWLRERLAATSPATIPATSRRVKGRTRKATDVLNIPTINKMAAARTGNQTQLPLQLLESLVMACKPPGGRCRARSGAAGRRWWGQRDWRGWRWGVTQARRRCVSQGHGSPQSLDALTA